MIFLIALVSACLLGLGFVAQQHAAYREPLGEILHPRLLMHLIRSRLWLTGIGLMFAGQVVTAVALYQADLTKVGPLLATSLLFALAAAHVVYQEHLSRMEWLGAALVSGGVALFLVFGQPQGGSSPGPDSARWLALLLVVAVAAVLVAVGLRRPLQVEASLLAGAAGMLYGVQDVLTRGSLLRLREGADVFAASWQPYVLVGVALVGLLLGQSAFDAAPLRISLPAATATEPIVGIVLGIVIFSEQVRVTSGALAGEVIGLIAMVTGIFILGRSPFLAKSEQAAPPRSEPHPGTR
ncbi:DMT family transporter [Streptosporangium sp. NPDC048047]|uniref:DMT family transporter n=1 Tax=Streptosporangium sp. NPDC048047 TaxID=3155748 RepID=UPI0034215B5C